MIGVLKYYEEFQKSTLQDILEFKYNDIGSVEKIVKENKNEIAAIITTPISHPPGKKRNAKKSFLNDLREITKKHNIVLIFDEIRQVLESILEAPRNILVLHLTFLHLEKL